MLGILIRVADEYRFGVRDVSVEDLRVLAETWGELNRGETPAEATLSLISQVK